VTGTPDIGGVGNARSERGVWSDSVVMGEPLGQGASQMLLVQRNDPVETLAPDGANESFAERVRLRGSDGRL